VQDGFDLDGDGKPDNKLSVGSLAMSAISDSMKNYEIIIPIEYFDLPTVAPDTCVKFAIYYGNYDADKDGDGKRPGISGGDCDDTATARATSRRDRDSNDGIDNDCDGLATRMARTCRTRRHGRRGSRWPVGRTSDCNDHDRRSSRAPGDLRRRQGQRLRRRRRSLDRRAGQRDRVQPVRRREPVDIKLDPLSFVARRQRSRSPMARSIAR